MDPGKKINGEISGQKKYYHMLHVGDTCNTRKAVGACQPPAAVPPPVFDQAAAVQSVAVCLQAGSVSVGERE